MNRIIVKIGGIEYKVDNKYLGSLDRFTGFALTKVFEQLEELNKRTGIIQEKPSEPESTKPYWELEGHQTFLCMFADATGCTGSPTIEDVLERIKRFRQQQEELGELIINLPTRNVWAPSLKRKVAEIRNIVLSHRY